MQPFEVIQLMASIMVPVILAIATAAYQSGRHDRAEILDRLRDIQTKNAELDNRLAVLEAEFMLLDLHPSRPKRGN